jgi:ribosomal protein S18 acetylase RimI-like enzyme
MYRIREVDPSDDEVLDMLVELHHRTFFGSAPLPDFGVGHWWVVWLGEEQAAFAGLMPSTLMPNSGYFCRVGVIPEHHGRGLQRRLMRAAESRAKWNGWNGVISDTTDNIVSANNFIRAGYRLFQPSRPWGWSNTLYWRKVLGSPQSVTR